MMSTHIVPLYSRTAGAEPGWAGLIFAGRSSALFALLAGVGLALLTGGSRPHGRERLACDRRSVLARAALIAGIGLTLPALDMDVAVILVHYSMLFLCALPFLGLQKRALLAWAAVWLIVSPLLGYLIRSGFADRLEPNRVGNPSWDSLFTPGLLLLDLTVTGYYPVLQWLTYILFGLLIGRLDLGSAAVQLRLMLWGAAAAVAAKAASWLLLEGAGGRAVLQSTPQAGQLPLDALLQTGVGGMTMTNTPWWLAISSPHSGTSFDLLHTIGTAAAVIGLCSLAAARMPRLLLPLTGAGAMTLSLYSAHLVALDWFSDAAEGWDPDVEFAGYAAVALAVGWLFAWRRWRGPLESLVSGTAAAARDSAAARSR